jgi:inosine/xanthosine triphosphate pyrophosphatase family protein/dephospho-CoA kinase
MDNISPPSARALFVEMPRRLEVGFHTSNIDKFLQARLVLQKFGLFLRHFPSSVDPYQEDYSLGRARLLERAIEEIKHRLGVNSLFFVEDTSVRIDALSKDDADVPGLAVKEWFAETRFEQLDQELRQRGNNRSATVFSDIALHVPGLNRPVLVTGETRGRVADSPPEFKRSEQYPWLTPTTFNGWFIPEGATKRLGEMKFEESLAFDFRVRSLTALVDRLEEYAAILNLGTHSYSVRRSLDPSSGAGLFGDDISLYVVVGKVCAGKTTFAHQASTPPRHYQAIEASNIMRLLAQEVGIKGPSAFYTARELLQQKGPDIIARRIVSMYGEELKHEHVITGFRTIEELEFIREKIPTCKVIVIDASERTRFERYLQRGRRTGGTTLQEFQAHDKEQWLFGLLPVAHDFADIRILNEGTLPEYHAQIDAILDGSYRTVPGVSEYRRSGATLRSTRLFRCLSALEVASGPRTCPEIAEGTLLDEATKAGERVERISARHVNWVLKDVPELARRVDVKGDRVHYEILPAGKAYLKAIRSMK